MKIKHIIKELNDLEQTKNCLFKIYKQFKNIYRFYAGKEPNGEVWGISG